MSSHHPLSLTNIRPKHSRGHSGPSTKLHPSNGSVSPYTRSVHSSASALQMSPHDPTPPIPPVSSSSSEDTPTRPNSRNTASRILTSVRKSFRRSSKERVPDIGPDISQSGMYSTAQEREKPSRFRFQDSAATPPTVEEIAMGLHTSRTPHLRAAQRSLHSHPRPSSPAFQPEADQDSPSSHHKLISLLPPPPRPSITKSSPSDLLPAPPPSSSSTIPATPILSSASLSSTTITSTAPSTPSTRSIRSLKQRMMFKLLRGGRRRPEVMPSSAQKEIQDHADGRTSSRKAVRFAEQDGMTGEHAEEESEPEPDEGAPHTYS